MKPYYLVITPFFPTPESFRGPFIYDQVKAINHYGKYQTIVLKPKMWYSSEKDYEFEGMKVFRFNNYDLPSYIFPGLFDFLTARSLKRKLKSIGVDLENVAAVHSHVTKQGVYGNFLKKTSSKIKTILQHHGFDVLSVENGILGRFAWHREWAKKYGIKICNESDINVGVSQKTLDYLTEVPEIKLKETFVLYNGVDTQKFYPVPGQKDPKSFTIGCIGNFWPLKDQITLIKAVEKLIKDRQINNIRLKFVGAGETLDFCKNYAVTNGLQNFIDFTESMPHNQLVNFYNALDLFVLPSYWEAFGCVYVEAHQCGVPFVAVEGQGISEVVLEKNKKIQLIDKSDEIGLAGLILEYYEGKARYEALAFNLEINHTVKNFLDAVLPQKDKRV